MSCGEIIYTANTVEMAPPDKDPLSKALTVDLSFKTVNIEFDIAKIGVEGLKADFSLKG